MEKNDIVILIPAYEPGEEMIPLLEQLHSLGVLPLVVNDGSGSDCSHIFTEAEQYAKVIGYEKNGGKGVAVKYGLRYICEHMPECEVIVTADADGQHLASDIIAAAQKCKKNKLAVFGERELRMKGVPLRSKVGNHLSKALFLITTGRFSKDNQCGLRAFPASYAKWLLRVPGKCYEWEMNVIISHTLANEKCTLMPVSTIYRNGNSSSHFSPLKDTLKIDTCLILHGLPQLLLYLLCMCVLAFSGLGKTDWITVAITGGFLVTHYVLMGIRELCGAAKSDLAIAFFQRVAVAAKYVLLFAAHALCGSGMVFVISSSVVLTVVTLLQGSISALMVSK